MSAHWSWFKVSPVIHRWSPQSSKMSLLLFWVWMSFASTNSLEFAQIVRTGASNNLRHGKGLYKIVKYVYNMPTFTNQRWSCKTLSSLVALSTGGLEQLVKHTCPKDHLRFHLLPTSSLICRVFILPALNDIYLTLTYKQDKNEPAVGVSEALSQIKERMTLKLVILTHFITITFRLSSRRHDWLQGSEPTNTWNLIRWFCPGLDRHQCNMSQSLGLSIAKYGNGSISSWISAKLSPLFND